MFPKKMGCDLLKRDFVLQEGGPGLHQHPEEALRDAFAYKHGLHVAAAGAPGPAVC